MREDRATEMETSHQPKQSPWDGQCDSERLREDDIPVLVTTMPVSYVYLRTFRMSRFSKLHCMNTILTSVMNATIIRLDLKVSVFIFWSPVQWAIIRCKRRGWRRRVMPLHVITVFVLLIWKLVGECTSVMLVQPLR
jgi:hypothetical protein